MYKIILTYYDSTNRQLQPAEWKVEYEGIPVIAKGLRDSLIKEAIAKLLSELK